MRILLILLPLLFTGCMTREESRFKKADDLALKVGIALVKGDFETAWYTQTSLINEFSFIRSQEQQVASGRLFCGLTIAEHKRLSPQLMQLGCSPSDPASYVRAMACAVPNRFDRLMAMTEAIEIGDGVHTLYHSFEVFDSLKNYSQSCDLATESVVTLPFHLYYSMAKVAVNQIPRERFGELMDSLSASIPQLNSPVREAHFHYRIAELYAQQRIRLNFQEDRDSLGALIFHHLALSDSAIVRNGKRGMNNPGQWFHELTIYKENLRYLIDSSTADLKSVKERVRRLPRNSKTGMQLCSLATMHQRYYVSSQSGTGRPLHDSLRNKQWGGHSSYFLNVAESIVEQIDSAGPEEYQFLCALHKSEALHRRGRVGEIAEKMATVPFLDSVDSSIPYNYLAQYEAQHGDSARAEKYLSKAKNLLSKDSLFSHPDRRLEFREYRKELIKSMATLGHYREATNSIAFGFLFRERLEMLTAIARIAHKNAHRSGMDRPRFDRNHQLYLYTLLRESEPLFGKIIESPEIKAMEKSGELETGALRARLVK